MNHAASAHLDPERLHLLLQVIKGQTANAAHRASEGSVHNVIAQAVDLKDLSAMVARQQTDAHLGKDLEHALLKGALVVPLRVLNADVCQLA